jgi:hypothetical protein
MPAKRNTLHFMAETGVTPKLGASQLPGKYAFYGYHWDWRTPPFSGEPF